MDLTAGAIDPAWAGRLERTQFASALAKGAPLIVASGDPPRLLYATPSALASFGVAGAHELEQVLFENNGLASRRLRRLAIETPSDASPRLELLRFFVARKQVNAHWLCGRITRARETYFVAAEPAPRSESELAAAPAPAPAEDAEAFQLRPLDGPIRFVWSFDADGRFGPPDKTVRERLGPNAPRQGESLDALAERTGLDPEGEFLRVCKAQSTFSGLRLVWPEPGGERARVVLVSGAPVFGSGHGFHGFRGFGIFTGEGVDRNASPETPETSAPIEAAAAAAPEACADSRGGPTASDAPDAEAAPAQKPDADAETASSPSSALPAPAARGAGGDANALIGLLQRQHAPVAASSPFPGDAQKAPALAIITALAALLQPKAGAPAAPSPRPPEPPTAEAEAAAPKAGGGAEIVVLRPSPAPAPANDQGAATAARESDSVSLTTQERDAFKEIARALGANVRNARSEPDALAEAAPVAEPPEPEPEPAASAAPISTAAVGLPAAPATHDFAALLDILPIAVLLFRGQETLYANRTLLDLTGYASLEDFRRRDGLRAIFRGRDPETLSASGAGGGIPLVAAGDRLMTVDAHTGPASWSGAAAVLVAMRRSREADHQAELRALERETEMHVARSRDYATALDAARDGMAKLDRGGRLLGMNKSAERLLGYDQNEAAGESFLTLLAPSSHAEATAALERLVRGDSGPVETLEVSARDQSGRVFPVRIDLGRLANQPEPDFFLLFSDLSATQVDATVSNSALEEAEKQNRAKTELLSRVSHEMRTPLHAIMGFAEVILEERFGPVSNDRYRDYIRDIHASGRHVLSLANDLLDMSKIELGKMDLEFSPIDINRVIRECVTLMQPQAARERIIVRLSLYDRLPNVMADERSLKQIMLNLMSNAVKYNEPGGQVIVSTALDDEGAAIVRVRDTGVGMSESELAVALEPFRRVPSAKVIEGSGLGLPLTKALVEANHADFTIKSRKDQGTLVEIAFPARKAAQ